MKLKDYHKGCMTTEPDEGLHVIGTCGDCKYWDLFASVTHPYTGQCLNEKRIRHKHHYFWTEDDGCIHWEPKE